MNVEHDPASEASGELGAEYRALFLVPQRVAPAYRSALTELFGSLGSDRANAVLLHDPGALFFSFGGAHPDELAQARDSVRRILTANGQTRPLMLGIHATSRAFNNDEFAVLRAAKQYFPVSQQLLVIDPRTRTQYCGQRERDELLRSAQAEHQRSGLEIVDTATEDIVKIQTIVTETIRKMLKPVSLA